MNDLLKLLSELQGQVRALEEHVEQIRDLRQELVDLERRLQAVRIFDLRGHVLGTLGDGQYRLSLATGERAFLRSPSVFDKGQAIALAGVQIGTIDGGGGLAIRVFREATPDDHLHEEALRRQITDRKARLSRLEIETFGGTGKPH
ncbi:MAG: hypothetical protein OZSIB_3127 [Candidatus Ozemobacter sibiricus]|jgi:hypothetical protein|uniref:Prefoldin subunit alpha n=1 Tax=Candidatus Ozemobacter sibiricus TaxID=2268124 RepID=A0A367ZSR1_9BACT|nr:MAG: hypothetical protein OZSIB_3127 [Candidatus Ozemobacter sibiricus]